MTIYKESLQTSVAAHPGVWEGTTESRKWMGNVLGKFTFLLIGSFFNSVDEDLQKNDRWKLFPGDRFILEGLTNQTNLQMPLFFLFLGICGNYIYIPIWAWLYWFHWIHTFLHPRIISSLIIFRYLLLFCFYTQNDNEFCGRETHHLLHRLPDSALILLLPCHYRRLYTDCNGIWSLCCYL